MHKFTLRALSVTLLAMAMLTGCSKKPAGPPPPELPPDGISGIPAPADRAADMAALGILLGTLFLQGNLKCAVRTYIYCT